MATIRQAAQDVLDEARDEIAWIALWKDGKGWATMAFWPDVNDNGTPTFDDDDLERLQNINAKDPAAVILNGYYDNLGNSEDMTRDSLANALRWHYENEHGLVAGYIN